MTFEGYTIFGENKSVFLIEIVTLMFTRAVITLPFVTVQLDKWMLLNKLSDE